LFGLQASQRGNAEAGLYDADATVRTYARLADGVRIAVNAGYRVIVDAAFLRRDERQSFHRLATELGVPFTILDCSASVAELRRRVQARHAAADDASDADVAVLERQLGFHQPLHADEQAVTLQVVTDQPYDPAWVADRWVSMIRAESARNA
ncbi:MAG: ATP-binding protein, partial [Gammaproteobacteria bacterium]|nr:ATP-binding protein [Gammaproteobacteria bacterium]